MLRLGAVLVSAAAVWAALAYGQSKWRTVGLDQAKWGAPADTPVDRIAVGTDHSLWMMYGGTLSMVTTDRGETWKRVQMLPDGYQAGAVSFSGSGAGWAVGSYKAFLATAPAAGGPWRVALTLPDIRAGGFADAEFFDGAAGVAVGGGDFNEGRRSLVAITRDGGANWKVQMLETNDGQPVLTRVVFQSREVLWAAGGGSIYVSRDGGANWTLSHSEAGFADFRGLAAVPGAGVFAVGGWGLIVRSTDFGKTWVHAQVPPSEVREFLVSVAFADARRGWVCGNHGAVLGTGDGGLTWQVEATNTNKMLRDIAVADGQVFAVGDDLTVIRRPL